jgi:hypothetical protein
MKKFLIVVGLVFALGIAAEWFMLGHPQKGVVLWMSYKPLSNSYTLSVQTSEGTPMQIVLPAKVWQEWLQPRRLDSPDPVPSRNDYF